MIPHYHIDKDWRENVVYEHKFNWRTYIYTPEQEINYLYRKWWEELDYKKEATLEYMMQYLVKKGIYEPVAMYFRNAYMREYEECPDGVLGVHVNGKGMKNIDLHVTMCCIVLLAVALTRLQHGFKDNLSSVPYLT